MKIPIQFIDISHNSKKNIRKIIHNHILKIARNSLEEMGEKSPEWTVNLVMWKKIDFI